MSPRRRAALLAAAAWAVLVLAGGTAIVRLDIAARREAFQTDARIAHRLLSQRAVQHEAMLATLVLLSPAAAPSRPEQRLPALYPQVLAVLRRGARRGLARCRRCAEAEAALARVAAAPGLAAVDAARPATPWCWPASRRALRWQVDMQRLVPWESGRSTRDGPVRVTLRQAPLAIALQRGEPTLRPRRGVTPGFVFDKALGTPSQPFDAAACSAPPGRRDWPWAAAGRAGRRARRWRRAGAARMAAPARRARSAPRSCCAWARSARLNALGELAAGMAHELNQPLTAVLANTQAARRLLDDEPPELDAARQALGQAVAQARRAADVVARLRRRVERPDAGGRAAAAWRWRRAVREVLDLLRAGAAAPRRGRAAAGGRSRPVQADPVALEQIVHNLVEQRDAGAGSSVPAGERRLTLDVASRSRRRAC